MVVGLGDERDSLGCTSGISHCGSAACSSAIASTTAPPSFRSIRGTKFSNGHVAAFRVKSSPAVVTK